MKFILHSSRNNRRKGQIFSVDVVIAIIVFIAILVSSAWYWDSTKEKIRMYEARNSLEFIASNSASVLISTVGDPPNWHNLSFTDDTVHSIGIGKNRAWMIDEEKASYLATVNSTNYSLIKRILGIRGSGYELYLNISKYSGSTDFDEIAVVGIYPNSSAAHVVNINRFAISDNDNSWVNIKMMIWSMCEGAECY